MFTVALVGPDGAGKTTISRRLAQTLPLPAKYFYMGGSVRASAVSLPSTRLLRGLRRLGARLPERLRGWFRRGSLLRRATSPFRKGLRLANQLCEEWYRQLWAAYYRRRGYLVVFDRHFASDHQAHALGSAGKRRRLATRLRGYLLKRFYPQPDLVICLDAPGPVLFARKGEWTPQQLEERRQAYLQMRGVVKNFVVVDASRPAEDVARTVRAEVLHFYRNRIHGSQP
jgi:thymidylate kinase